MSESSAPDERVDEHVVFFTTALGDPAAERYPTLQSAVSRVESLCNEDHVEDAKVYALVPVPLQVHSYVRIEVDSSVYRTAPPIPAAPATPPPSAAGETGAMASTETSNESSTDAGTGVEAPYEEDPSATADQAPYDPADHGPEPVPSDTVTAVPDGDDGAPSHGRNLGFFVH